MKDECEEQLDLAMPALNEAIAALDTLKPQDISAIKTMQNPPAGVQTPNAPNAPKVTSPQAPAAPQNGANQPAANQAAPANTPAKNGKEK